MDESFNILLNGMPLKEFWVWYVVALAGALVYLLSKIYRAINNDPNTPNKFSWKHTIRGFIKLIIAMIIIPWVIIYFKQITPFLLDFLTQDGIDLNNIEMEINGFSAFLIGLGIDYLVHRVLGVTKSIQQKIKKS